MCPDPYAQKPKGIRDPGLNRLAPYSPAEYLKKQREMTLVGPGHHFTNIRPPA
jgi:hypothetical protein